MAHILHVWPTRATLLPASDRPPRPCPCRRRTPPSLARARAPDRTSPPSSSTWTCAEPGPHPPSFLSLALTLGRPSSALCSSPLRGNADRVRTPRPPSQPQVAFSSTPTVGAPPLTWNFAAPLVSSPLLGESHHRAPSSLPLQLSSDLIAPSLSRSRRCTSVHHQPLSDLPPPLSTVKLPRLRHLHATPPCQ
jgi:hypothetical protein